MRAEFKLSVHDLAWLAAGGILRMNKTDDPTRATTLRVAKGRSMTKDCKEEFLTAVALGAARCINGETKLLEELDVVEVKKKEEVTFQVDPFTFRRVFNGLRPGAKFQHPGTHLMMRLVSVMQLTPELHLINAVEDP